MARQLLRLENRVSLVICVCVCVCVISDVCVICVDGDIEGEASN